MSRKIIKKISFLEKLSTYTKENVAEDRQVFIAKNKYLLENKEDIIKASELGYPFHVIAEIATRELLERDIPKSFVFKSKDGDEVKRETLFTAGEIKKFYLASIEN